MLVFAIVTTVNKISWALLPVLKVGYTMNIHFNGQRITEQFATSCSIAEREQTLVRTRTVKSTAADTADYKRKQ
jgi:hypothetical protein